MSIENIKTAVPDYAKDLRINLVNVLTKEGSPGLTEKQIFGTALSIAFTVKNSFLADNLLSASENLLSEKDIQGIKTAVSLMGMNNIYYKAVSLTEDDNLLKRPAGLRMSLLVGHGIPQTDFEIYSLAVSSLSGCKVCVKSHSEKLKREGLSNSAIHSVIKISAVVQGLNQSLNL